MATSGSTWYYLSGIILCVTALITVCYCWCIRHRIELTAAIISVVVRRIALCPGIIVVAAIALVLKALWFVFAMLVFYSGLHPSALSQHSRLTCACASSIQVC